MKTVFRRRTTIIEKLDEAIAKGEIDNMEVEKFLLTSGEMLALRKSLMAIMSPAPELNYTVLEYRGIPCFLDSCKLEDYDG